VRKPGSNPTGQMTIIEHLAELRRRLIISFIAVALGAVACWILYPQIIDLLLQPYCDTLPSTQECQLYVRNPLEPFSVKLTVAGYGGIALAIPVLLYHLWRFVAPALYSREKRYAVPFIVSGVLLFGLGAGLAYLTIPQALSFLAQMGGEDFTELFSPNDYLSFVIKMLVGFGIGFEFPLVLIFLQLLGVLEYQSLASRRRYALVGVVTLVAILTPSGDPFSLAILSVPMYLFFEASVAFGWIRERRGRRTVAAA